MKFWFWICIGQSYFFFLGGGICFVTFALALNIFGSSCEYDGLVSLRGKAYSSEHYYLLTLGRSR